MRLHLEPCLALLLATGCASFEPVSGEWVLDDRFVTADECGLTDGDYTQDFSLSYRGEDTFFLVYEEDVRTCELSSADFVCNDLEELLSTEDSETLLTRSFSGSFADETALTVAVDYLATCTGTGCEAELGVVEGESCAASVVLDLSTILL